MITRIRELLDARQLSPTQFADLIGVGRPVMSHILSERNKPSLEVVQKIIGAFPDISLPWLLAGTGPMLAATVAVSPAPTPAPIAPEITVVAPVLAAPAVAAAAPSPSTPPPAASTRPTTTPQPSIYPLPPRFRPATAGSAAPTRANAVPAAQRPASNSLPTAPVSAEASFSALETLAPTATLAATAWASSDPLAPLVGAAPSAAGPTVAAPAQALPFPPAAAPMPPVTTSLSDDPTTPTPEAATLPSNPEALATATHPAAALSFLGEPGKAIRRIVIFYRDGSFSDFLPEAS